MMHLLVGSILSQYAHEVYCLLLRNIVCVSYAPDFFYYIQIERNLQESKLAAEEKATAIKTAEDGASDLKINFQKLSNSLDEHQKEFQVNC